MNNRMISLPLLRRLVLAAAALACALPLTLTQAQASPFNWIAGEKIQGSGNMTRQTRELAHFTAVSLNLPGKLELRIGNTESVSIETDDNLLPLIESVIEDGMLKLRPAKRNLNLQPRNLRIVVQARSVDQIKLGGSGSIESDALKGDKLRFEIGGSGSINVKGLDGDSAVVAIGGSGNLRSGPGKVNRVSVSIGGSGDVDLGQVRAQDASVNVAGSGEALVWASNSLSASIAGSGDVKYYGDPKTSKSVAGSGTLRRMGDAPGK